MFAQITNLLLEPLRQRDVVAVHACDEIAAAMVQSAPQQTDIPAVLERKKADTVVVFGKLLNDANGRISRAVVKNDELKIGERLSEHALNRARNVSLGVEHRHDYGNRWHL